MGTNKFVVRKITLVQFLICIAPILNTYAFPIEVISWGEIMLCTAALICVTLPSSEGNVNRQITDYKVFMLYAFIITLFMTIFLSDTSFTNMGKELVTIILYGTLFIIMVKKIEIYDFLELYSTIAFYLAIILILQFLIHLITGNWVPGIIPNLQSDDGVSTSQIIYNMQRACSLFKEPAHYAQYMAIPLSYELLKNGNKNKKRIITMMVSLILTFSGNALLILAVAFMGIELKLLFCNRLNDFIKGLFLVIVLIVCFEIALYKIPYFQSTIARLTEGEILGNTSSRYSGYIRVLRGYEVYMKFGFFEKIFGIGIGNYTSYSESNFLSVLTSKTSILTSYLNGIQYYLISTGVIGLFLYIKSIVRNAFNSSIFIKIVILQFLALSAIAGLYKGCIWIIFMLVIFNGFNEDMSWEV